MRSAGGASRVKSPGSTKRSASGVGSRRESRAGRLRRRTRGIRRLASSISNEASRLCASGAVTDSLAERDRFRPMSGLALVRSRTLSCQRRTCALTRSRSIGGAGPDGVAAVSTNGVSAMFGVQAAMFSANAHYSQRARDRDTCWGATASVRIPDARDPTGRLAENASLTYCLPSLLSAPLSLATR
jgi:hypothetical protein